MLVGIKVGLLIGPSPIAKNPQPGKEPGGWEIVDMAKPFSSGESHNRSILNVPGASLHFCTTSRAFQGIFRTVQEGMSFWVFYLQLHPGNFLFKELNGLPR